MLQFGKQKILDVRGEKRTDDCTSNEAISMIFKNWTNRSTNSARNNFEKKFENESRFKRRLPLRSFSLCFPT